MKKQLLFITFIILSFTKIYAQPTNYFVCDDNYDGVAEFNLSQKIPELLNGSDPAINIVTFHLTQVDAFMGTNPISNSLSFTAQSGQVIYVRIQNTVTNQINYPVFSLIVNLQPFAGSDGTITICETSTTAIDLFNIISAEQPGGVWVRTTGVGGTFNAVAGTFTPSIGTTTSTFQYAITGLPPCTNDSSNATIIVLPEANCNPLGCGGSFIDNGGATANYTDNTNQVVTICPSVPGEAVTVSFTSFDVETNNDALYVFDGLDTGVSMIASTNGSGNVPGGLSGGYWGNTIPGPFTSSNPNGCLTFWFRSNDTINLSGWVANVTCNPIDQFVLTAFIDSNSNGTMDNGEPLFTEGSFVYEINESGTNNFLTTYTGSTGLMNFGSGNSYDFSYVINSELTPYLSCTVSYENSIALPGSGAQTLYFPITITNPYDDVSITVIPQSSPRLGFSYANMIIYKNNGFSTASGTITFVKDPNVTISSVNPTGSSLNSNGFTFDYSNLNPLETRYILVQMNVPSIPIVNINDVLTNSASITSNNSEFTLSNNTFSNSQIVVGSYDPNDKMESHGGFIQLDQFTANDYLYYTIRFQNEGTANALTVKIEDLLDTQLDENSLRMVSASHNYRMQRIGQQIIWTFNNINLPPTSVNEELSKGYVTFKIKPKSGYAVGDVIPNTAEIYFDTNPAIVTNTFNTEFVPTLGTSNFEFNNILVFPNPANNLVHISSENAAETIGKVTITDISGKTILSIQPNDVKYVPIDVSTIAKGVYFVEITSKNNNKQVKKLLIE